MRLELTLSPFRLFQLSRALAVPDRTDDEPAPSPSVGVPVPIPAIPPATAPFPQPLVDDNAAAADDDATRAQTVATKCQGMSLADRSTALRQAILDQTVTAAGRLDTPDNPQSVSLQWIDEVDPLVLCPDAPGLVQRYTLAVLYASLGGADWTTQDGWWTGDYVCSWYGVTCETDAAAAGGTVAKVSLKANNLQGFLPSEILALPGLTGLSLDHNAIRGQIPTTLGLATTLQYIELDDNALRGTIPSELYQLTQLQAIDFNTNKLSGTLSPSIRNLSNLVVLQLEQNQLTGTIPTSALRQLNDLGAYWNHCRGQSERLSLSLTQLCVFSFFHLPAVLLTLHDNSWSAGSSLDGVCDFVPARRQSNPAYLQFFSSDCSDTTSCPCCSQCF